MLDLTAKAVYEVIYETVSPTSSSHPSVRFHNLLSCAGRLFLPSVKTESLGWSKLKDNLLKKKHRKQHMGRNRDEIKKDGDFSSVSLPRVAYWDYGSSLGCYVLSHREIRYAKPPNQDILCRCHFRAGHQPTPELSGDLLGCGALIWTNSAFSFLIHLCYCAKFSFWVWGYLYWETLKK